MCAALKKICKRNLHSDDSMFTLQHLKFKNEIANKTSANTRKPKKLYKAKTAGNKRCVCGYEALR